MERWEQLNVTLTIREDGSAAMTRHDGEAPEDLNTFRWSEVEPGKLEFSRERKVTDTQAFLLKRRVHKDGELLRWEGSSTVADAIAVPITRMK